VAQGRFGPNEWLVDEIYQQYLADRESVDPAWWDFFADYTPADGSALKAQLDHAAACPRTRAFRLRCGDAPSPCCPEQ
jgi:2-oxoglutarate dehydrogenase E1 component